ncbi:transposase [Chlorogloea sp. CCALA 695]|uniref:transposase n=1 Tax=Chlorogloea sp. CCALA 695 TaxID=2107693 RepID=UPI000D06B56C|nr:transposase [Chlorogloea sp. CCALA 695]
MTGKKISESIKNEIIHLYKHTGETTSTLAERYGVSNSTISRMLKSTLPEQEYEVLIASKRAARVPATDTVKQLTNPREIEPSLVVAQPQTELKLGHLEEKTATSTPIIKRRSLSSQPEIPVAIDDSTRQNRPPIETEDYAEPSAKSDYAELSAKSDYAEPSAKSDYAEPSVKSDYAEPSVKSDYAEPSVKSDRNSTLIIPNTEINFAPPISKVIASSSEQLATNNLSFPTEEETSAIVAEMLTEDMLEEAEDSEGLDDEDLDYSDDDDDLEEEPTKIVKRPSSSNVLIQVLPLSEANLPKTCYLVIDRLSELITRPLKEFGDLGQIPAQETNQKTLPVFDNHRVARRFSTKRDRVIKVPDSKMLQKACPHLQAKGITRLLVDGQVYSLYPN